MKSIYLYPSTCYFEATPVSLGRGTDWPFQIYGHPNMVGYTFSFTPRSVPGAKNPPLLNKKCYGVDLTRLSNEEIWEKGINFDVYNFYTVLQSNHKCDHRRANAPRLPYEPILPKSYRALPV